MTVSIVMPVYNVEAYLVQTLNCLINQTYKDLEIVCVDDGSNDGSLKILKQFSQKDNRIRVYSLEHIGAGEARNVGLSKVTGEFVMFLDSDDEFSPKLIEVLYEKMNSENSDIVYCDYNEYSEGVEKRSKYPFVVGDKPYCKFDYPNCLFSISFSVVWNKMFRKSFLDKHKLQFMNVPHSNDIYFVFMALALAEKICYVDMGLVNHIIRESSITNNRTGDNFCDVEVYKRITQDLKKLSLFSLLKKSLYKVLLQSYSDAFGAVRKTRYDYFKFIEQIKKFLPWLALYYNSNNKLGRKFLLIKILPVNLSYLYYKFMKRF